MANQMGLTRRRSDHSRPLESPSVHVSARMCHRLVIIATLIGLYFSSFALLLCLLIPLSFTVLKSRGDVAGSIVDGLAAIGLLGASANFGYLLGVDTILLATACLIGFYFISDLLSRNEISQARESTEFAALNPSSLRQVRFRHKALSASLVLASGLVGVVAWGGIAVGGTTLTLQRISFLWDWATHYSLFTTSALHDQFVAGRNSMSEVSWHGSEYPSGFHHILAKVLTGADGSELVGKSNEQLIVPFVRAVILTHALAASALVGIIFSILRLASSSAWWYVSSWVFITSYFHFGLGAQSISHGFINISLPLVVAIIPFFLHLRKDAAKLVLLSAAWSTVICIFSWPPLALFPALIVVVYLPRVKFSVTALVIAVCTVGGGPFVLRVFTIDTQQVLSDGGVVSFTDGERFALYGVIGVAVWLVSDKCLRASVIVATSVIIALGIYITAGSGKLSYYATKVELYYLTICGICSFLAVTSAELRDHVIFNWGGLKFQQPKLLRNGWLFLFVVFMAVGAGNYITVSPFPGFGGEGYGLSRIHGVISVPQDETSSARIILQASRKLAGSDLDTRSCSVLITTSMDLDTFYEPRGSVIIENIWFHALTDSQTSEAWTHSYLLGDADLTNAATAHESLHVVYDDGTCFMVSKDLASLPWYGRDISRWD